jgi:hypothetical protein
LIKIENRLKTDCKDFLEKSSLRLLLKKSLKEINKLLIFLQNKTHGKRWSKNLEKIVGSSFWKDSLM